MLSGSFFRELPVDRDSCCRAVNAPMLSGSFLRELPVDRDSCFRAVRAPMLSGSFFRELSVDRDSFCSAVRAPMLSGSFLRSCRSTKTAAAGRSGRQCCPAAAARNDSTDAAAAGQSGRQFCPAAAAVYHHLGPARKAAAMQAEALQLGPPPASDIAAGVKLPVQLREGGCTCCRHCLLGHMAIS